MELIRGAHGTAYTWPIPRDLLKSVEFTKGLFGEDLHRQFIDFRKQILLVNEDSMTISKAEFLISTIEILRSLTNKDTVLGQVFRDLSLNLLDHGGASAPDTSIGYSETPTYFLNFAKFFLFDTKRVVTEHDDEFTLLQQQYKNKHLRAFLFDTKRVVTEHDDEFTLLQQQYKNKHLRAFLFFDQIPDIDYDLWYDDEHVVQLLRGHLDPDNNVTYQVLDPIVFEATGILLPRINQAVNAINAGQVVVMPIHLHGNHWVGAVFRAIRDEQGVITGVNVFYNNPQGHIVELENNAIRLVKTIHARVQDILHVDVYFHDLHLRQQRNGHDCGPFTVDNLLRLATATGLDVNGLTLDDIIRLADLRQFGDNEAGAQIRAVHNDIFLRLGLTIPTANEDTKTVEENTEVTINNVEEHFVPEEIYTINSDEFAVAITYALSFGIFFSDYL